MLPKPDTYTGLMKGPAGFDVANRVARIYGTGNNPLCWTPLSTIALAAGNMLRNPEPITNRPILICPLAQLTQNKILGALEDVLGTKFTVEHVDIEKIYKNATIALERGEVVKAMKGLTVGNQFYEGSGVIEFSGLVENEIVGVEMMTLNDAVKHAIEHYGEDCKVMETMFRVEACEI
jgi:hypothetical protein